VKDTLDWTKLSELLAKETYPLPYILKLIGKNTPQFEESLQQFEQVHVRLSRVSSRITPNGKSVSVSYQWVAQGPDEIIAVYERASQLAELMVLL
jgi:putative lipoic acid-binding regulatory protein